MKFRCAYCRKSNDKPTGEVNRARAAGYALYCNRKCSRLARRKGKTKAQRVAEKRLYDMEYRATNAAKLKAKKHEYHLRTYDPKKEAIKRKKRMPYHVQYCRQPWYKEWKRKYDADYRAKEFGEFADAYRFTLELEREIKRRFNHEEIKYQEGSRNKAQRRKREAGQTQRRNRHSSSHRQ